MQEQIFDLLLTKEDVTWKSLLYDLVQAEGMDPWSVDVTKLTNKYIQTIKEMQEHDLKISGKILLAAAILLKIKTSHLLDHDISNLDRLIAQTDDELLEEEFIEEFEDPFHRSSREKEQYTLIPRNPQPRNRKVSIHDLVNALQKAMATKKRILAKNRPQGASFEKILPKGKVDIMGVIREIYNKITYYEKKDSKKEVTFSRLLPPRAGKNEKVYTFLPLLHLENQKKIATRQENPFDEIYVKLLAKTKAKRKSAKA